MTYVRKSTPELEKALLLVRSLRGKFKCRPYYWLDLSEVSLNVGLTTG